MKLITFTFFASTFFLSIFMITCDQDSIAPKHDNPLDGKNAATVGDPFNLTAILSNTSITLNWSSINIDSIKGYNIYRSEVEISGFLKLGTVLKSVTSYVDTNIITGHSYWYKITAFGKSSKESSQTNVVPVNVNTNPYLAINGGLPYTSQTEVSLSIYAANASQMIISNKSDFSNANWESYHINKSWSLSPGQGTKTIYLKVKYSDEQISNISSANIILDTETPFASFSVSPESGITNETLFTFNATLSSDNYKLMLRWDWDNNGNYDTDWSNEKIVSYQYSLGGGEKTIKLEVMDGAGAISTTTEQIFVNTRPVAGFTASSALSDTAEMIMVDASTCYDYEDNSSLLEIRWDWEADGIWDTEYSTSKTATHQYLTEGTKTIILEVKDSDGLTNTITKQHSNGETITDIDGNNYKIIKIGDQWWMAENLKVTHYRNGNQIPNITSDSEWIDLSTGAYCNYNNDKNNATTYGRLYNWYAVNDSRNIAPEGWHVASDDDWKELEMYLGMSQSDADKEGIVYRGTNEGSKLAGNAVLWDYGFLKNNAAFGESGFSAIPSGFRHCNYGSYDSISMYAFFWSSTDYSSGNNAWSRNMDCQHSEIFRFNYPKRYGFSVRCVKD